MVWILRCTQYDKANQYGKTRYHYDKFRAGKWLLAYFENVCHFELSLESDPTGCKTQAAAKKSKEFKAYFKFMNTSPIKKEIKMTRILSF